MDDAPAPIATITHAALRVFLAQQPWPWWAVDTAALDPLRAYQPVALTRLLRVLKSHYIFSDVYVFNAASTAAQIAAIDWQRLPHLDSDTIAPYVIARAAGKPLLGIAGSLDTAWRGDVVCLLPAHNETRFVVEG